MMRDSELALWMSVKLFEDGICTYPMMYPIVPRNKCRLRFFINTNHTREQIDQTIARIQERLRTAPKSKGILSVFPNRSPNVRGQKRTSVPQSSQLFVLVMMREKGTGCGTRISES